MINAWPDYYKDFVCIASRCRHSCCIGWEIDIDPESAALYKSLDGELGERMKKCIDWSGEPHFILGEHERCPFLNENYLCDIILALGEESISEICTDHPRFRSYLSERTELGLGLCCEEAARLILTKPRPFEIIEEGEGEYSADEDYLMDLREDIFRRIFQDGPRSLPKAQGRSIGEWARFYKSLERLDEAWTDRLDMLIAADLDAESIDEFMGDKMEYKNLCAYFIYRHLFSALDDGDIESKILFAALSCRMIAALEMSGKEDIAEYARMYSSEIEYSDENLGLIFEALKEKP